MSPADELGEEPTGIAIIGLAGRFPGSPDLEAFWRNLRDGVEGISFFSTAELTASGIAPELAADPAYVPARGIVDDVDLFDAEFFDFSPREAEITDPQHRLILECAWEALENAGYDPARSAGLIGTFAGIGVNRYAQAQLFSASFNFSVHDLELHLANDKDHLATRVAYKLDLRGPALTVQTACSSSLVAVHLACQSLLCGECDMALAGGVWIAVPQRCGYLWAPESIMSPDGRCRAFDAGACGTVSGNGLGIVVLKRLGEALADGDRVRAVVKGSAINNDGAARVGYTAPGLGGQAAVIREAQAVAGVDPATITYVEAHGTGTALGDPIEVAALARAFGPSAKRASCAIGSVKTNVGHLGVAAGVTGLIKTVLAIEHGEIPPSLHFHEPNPEIDFAATPFFVNTQLRPWPRGDTPRRAGVSSFGMGGTNAHVVIEEAPAVPAPVSSSRPEHLLVLSARTATALAASTVRLRDHLAAHRDPELADAAFTLQVGRQAFEHRRAVVCRDVDDAIDVLGGGQPERLLTRRADPGERLPAFMFPGQGTQHVNMGRALYEHEPSFRAEVDRCCELLSPGLGVDLSRLLYPPAGEEEAACRQLEQTAFTQPALFVVEYALARLWMAWGVRPWAMIGHSLGEYVAACLADVLSLEDALALVALRGRLVQELPPGAMLSVPLAAEALSAKLGPELALAAINGPERCVVSGPAAAVDELAAQLAGDGVETGRLRTSHAFHSAQMTVVEDHFLRRASAVEFREPRLPWVSCVTGRWIRPEEATDAGYWARQLSRPVRFADGLGELAGEEGAILLEVGPGRTLQSLARQHPATACHTLLGSLPEARDRRSGRAFLLKTLGRLWLTGQPVDWRAVHAPESRRRVELHTYPFERKRYRLAAAAGIPARQDPAPPPQAGAEPAAPPPATAAGSRERRVETPYVAPCDEREKDLVAVWQEMLGIEPIGVHDDFFELGGGSLQAARCLSRIRHAGGSELTMQQFAEAATVARLSRLLCPEAPDRAARAVPSPEGDLEEWEI